MPTPPTERPFGETCRGVNQFDSFTQAPLLSDTFDAIHRKAVLRSFKEKVSGKRPSPALIISLLALFVALGGTSYAAMKVNGKDISNRSIAGSKIKKNVLTTKEVKDKSLLKADFKPGQIPAGAAGPPGPAGTPGATSVVMRKGSVINILAGNFQTGTANCLPGEKATGGGVFNQSQVFSMAITSSYPIPNGTDTATTLTGVAATGWKVWVANNSLVTHDVQAYVMCVSP